MQPLDLFAHRHPAPTPTAPPLIILHGLFGSGGNWRRIATALSAARDVHCLDLRNHGQSPWHDEMTYAAMAADVRRYIAEHNLGKVAVLGHSMGGKVAMTLAQTEPAVVHKLIVADIAPKRYAADEHLGLIAAMSELNLSANNRAQLDVLLAKSIADMPTRQFLMQNLALVDGGYRWRLNLDALRCGMDGLTDYDNAKTSSVDALFITGAESDYVLPADHCEITARFPNARVETVENAGHWLHAQQPEAVIGLCWGFLGNKK